MTQVFETIEANQLTSIFPETVLTASGPQTIIAEFGTQNTFTISQANANALGLSSTTVRGDVFRFDVQFGQSYAASIAILGAGGGTLPDVGFVVAGDNNSAKNGTILNSASFTNIQVSNASTTSYTEFEFSAAGHDYVYAFVYASASDTGTYSVSFANSLADLGDDVVPGTSGDDVLQGYRGDDMISGGDGQDTAAYVNTDDKYIVEIGGEIKVLDKTTNEGVDTLLDMETIQFDGRTFDLSKFDSGATLSKAQFTSFTEMYIAYFNRAPDAAGLLFWADAFATGTSIETIAALFAGSPEAQALFSSNAGSSTFVEAIYLNVLGRASDPAGKAFWVGVLDQGTVSQGTFVLEILKGARAPAELGSDPGFIAQKAADVAFLNAKVDIGLYYGAHLGMSDVNDARSVMQLVDGTQQGFDAAEAQALNFAINGDAYKFDGTGELVLRVTGVADDPVDPFIL